MLVSHGTRSFWPEQLSEVLDTWRVSRYLNEPGEPVRRSRIRVWRDHARGIGRAVKAIFGRVLLPLLCVFALAIVIVDFGPTLRASRGEGVIGTFTAERRLCSTGRGGSSCVWYGSFAARDGGTHFDEALLDADPEAWQPGATAEVVWTGGTDPVAVYQPGDNFAFGVVVAFGLLSLTALTAWAVALACRVRRRPPPRWITMLQHLASWR